jgi:hypothetical protein
MHYFDFVQCYDLVNLYTLYIVLSNDFSKVVFYLLNLWIWFNDNLMTYIYCPLKLVKVVDIWFDITHHYAHYIQMLTVLSLIQCNTIIVKAELLTSLTSNYLPIKAAGSKFSRDWRCFLQNVIGIYSGDRSCLK